MSDECYRRRAADKETPKEHALASDLESWKDFSASEFEQIKSNISDIKENQSLHIDVLQATKSDLASVKLDLHTNTRITTDLNSRYDKQEAGIDELLAIMAAVNGTRKTAWYAGKGLIFTSAVIGAWEVIKTFSHKFFT